MRSCAPTSSGCGRSSDAGEGQQAGGPARVSSALYPRAVNPHDRARSETRSAAAPEPATACHRLRSAEVRTMGMCAWRHAVAAVAGAARASRDDDRRRARAGRRQHPRPDRDGALVGGRARTAFDRAHRRRLPALGANRLFEREETSLMHYVGWRAVTPRFATRRRATGTSARSPLPRASTISRISAGPIARATAARRKPPAWPN